MAVRSYSMEALSDFSQRQAAVEARLNTSPAPDILDLFKDGSGLPKAVASAFATGDHARVLNIITGVVGARAKFMLLPHFF